MKQPPPNGQIAWEWAERTFPNFPNVTIPEGLAVARITDHRIGIALEWLLQHGCQDKRERLIAVRKRIRELWIPALEKMAREQSCAEQLVPGSGVFTWLVGSIPFEGSEYEDPESGETTEFMPEFLAPDLYAFECAPTDQAFHAALNDFPADLVTTQCKPKSHVPVFALGMLAAVFLFGRQR